MNNPMLVLVLAAFVAIVLMLLSRSQVRSRNRQIARAQAWPPFVDSVVSSLLAGLTIHEALVSSVQSADKALSAPFAVFASDLEQLSLPRALQRLSVNLRLATCDEFSVLLQVNARLGGSGLVKLLQGHSKRVRDQNSVAAQLRTKVSATLAMAKLAVIAPWVLLVLLLSRPETAHAFDTANGVVILLLGLAMCVVAYKLVGVLGRYPEARRIYAPF